MSATAESNAARWARHRVHCTASPCWGPNGCTICSGRSAYDSLAGLVDARAAARPLLRLPPLPLDGVARSVLDPAAVRRMVSPRVAHPDPPAVPDGWVLLGRTDAEVRVGPITLGPGALLYVAPALTDEEVPDGGSA